MKEWFSRLTPQDGRWLVLALGCAGLMGMALFASCCGGVLVVARRWHTLPGESVVAQFSRVAGGGAKEWEAAKDEVQQSVCASLVTREGAGSMTTDELRLRKLDLWAFISNAYATDPSTRKLHPYELADRWEKLRGGRNLSAFAK